eukprot:scaffold699_cov231-Pinguiococcus_pyrenoidosus.AAC.8
MTKELGSETAMLCLSPREPRLANRRHRNEAAMPALKRRGRACTASSLLSSLLYTDSVISEILGRPSSFLSFVSFFWGIFLCLLFLRFLLLCLCDCLALLLGLRRWLGKGPPADPVLAHELIHSNAALWARNDPESGEAFDRCREGSLGRGATLQPEPIVEGTPAKHADEDHENGSVRDARASDGAVEA